MDVCLRWRLAVAEVKRRSTWQRSAIVDLLERSQVFLSAQQIHAELEEEGTKVGLATVYRNLQSLAEEDLVDTVRSDDGEALYRLCTNEGHHHHLVCRSCGKAVEIAGSLFENWVHDIASANGFTKVEHVAEFFGLCNECSQKQANN
ncbi:MAG: transcriptional repressor [Actinomyces graevenitzii]|nr:transcriptional repressor [Actinomyces graevenitzii]